MAVFRIERTKDYTVMSNHHLRNHELSLKAKGLLSMMLSLPDDWNYTTRGLAKICKEGVDAIGSALRELETAGYIVRNQLRDQQGRISDTEYVIYEKPQPRQPETPRPDTAVPDTASPDTENPYLDKPDTEKPAELNIEKPNTQKQNTHGASTDSIPFRETAAAQLPERKGRDAMSVSEIENYRELILENIEYNYKNLGLISMVVALLGVAVLITYSLQNGIILLVIAFLISPYGLPMAAIWLLGKVQDLKFIIQDLVYG